VAQEFLIYVLAAFLLTWSEQLRTMEFQDLVMYLQASACAISTGLWLLCKSHTTCLGTTDAHYMYDWLVSHGHSLAASPDSMSYIALRQLKSTMSLLQ